MQSAFLGPQLVYKQKQEYVHRSLPVCQVYLRSVRKENYDPIKRTRKSLAAVPTIMKNTEWNQGLRRHSTEMTKDEQARWRAEQAAIPRACQILPGGHKDLKDDVFLCLQVCQCENYKDYSKACLRALLLCSIHSGSLRLTEQGPWYLYLSCSALGTEPENSLTFLDKVVLLLLMSPRPHLPASSWHSASKRWVCVPLLWLFSNRLKQTSIPVLLHFILRTEILSIDVLSWHEQVLLKELDSRTRPLLLNARTTIFSLESDRSPKDKALGSAGQKEWAWGAKFPGFESWQVKSLFLPTVWCGTNY